MTTYIFTNRILNKDLENKNLILKTHITTLAGYAQNTLETVPRRTIFSNTPTALIVRALRCKKYEIIWTLKGQIKTYTGRIFNTLEIHSHLLDFLILLVAVDIHLNLCPSSS